MPGEIIGELIFRPIFESVCYGTGKLCVRLLSLGRLHTSLTAEPDRKGKREKRWYSLTFTCGGKRYLETNTVALIGIVVWVAIIAILFLGFYRR